MRWTEDTVLRTNSNFGTKKVCNDLGTTPTSNGSRFNPIDLLHRQVFAERAGPARLVPDVERILLEAMIEDPHRACIPANPHAAAQILGRGGIVGLGHLDVAIAINRALGLLKRGEPLGRQWPQDWLLDFAKHTTDVLPCGAMNPGVGDIRLPMCKMAILFVKTLEPAAFECSLLHVIDAAFNLALMPWREQLTISPLSIDLTPVL